MRQLNLNPIISITVRVMGSREELLEYNNIAIKPESGFQIRESKSNPMVFQAH